LPALRLALDLLYKGYIKPKDYFSLIYDRFLFNTLRRLVFENASYRALIEYVRVLDNLALLAAIKSSSNYIR
ncbi:hypothetical protein CERZMDRAFT_45388, partial [Cercospora zeae-maydis SCOH1-5]